MNRTWDLALRFGLILLVFIVYWPVRDGAFVFDDRKLVVENQELWEGTGFDLNVMQDRSEDPVRTNYRPIRFLSYKLDALLTDWLLDRQPDGTPRSLFFHLQNILLHAINSLLILLITRRLFPDLPSVVGYLVALAFALHPIQTESVAYVSGRRDVLFTLLYFLAVWIYLRCRPGLAWWSGGAIVGCFTAALLSKEMAISLPFTILAIELGRPGPEGRRIPWKLLAVLGVVAVAFVYSLLAVGKPGGGTDYWGGSPWTAFWTSARVQMHYLGLLLWPFSGLTIDYSFSAFPVSKGPLAPWTGAASIVAIVGLLIASLWAWFRGLRWLAVLVPLYFVSLAPVAQILPHPERMAERFLYLSSAIFLAALTTILWRWGRRAPLPAVGAAAFLLIMFTVTTRDRLQDWQTPYALWKSAVTSHPNCARAQFGLGNAARRLGRPGEAVAALDQAIRLLEPVERDRLQQGYYLQSLIFRADLLATSSVPADLEQAVLHYEALRQETDTDGKSVGDDPVVLHGLRKALQKLERPDQAQAVARQLGDLDTTSPLKLEALLYVAGNQAQNEKAEAAWETLREAEAFATTDRQRAVVDYQRGIHWQREEKWTQARQAFLKARKLFGQRGNWTSAAYLAAECLVHLKREEAAADELRALLEQDPTHLPARLSLGDLCLGMGNLDEAQACYVDVLNAVPKHQRALDGIRAIRVRREYTEEKPAGSGGQSRAQVLKLLGERMLAEEKPEKAIDAFRRADDNADGPKNRQLRAEIRMQLARTLARQTQWEEAVAAYQGYLETQPLKDRDPEVILEASEALRQSYDYEGATKLLEEHWEAEIRHPSMPKNLGHLAIKLRNRDQALLWYRRALEGELSAAERKQIESLVQRLEQM